MHEAQRLVREFHKAINHPTSPAEPRIRDSFLRARLLLEEAIETAIAFVGPHEISAIVTEELRRGLERAARTKSSSQLVEAIDGLCDTIVVSYGAAEALGVDLEPYFAEVMRSNMAKASGPVRPDGKREKPPGWTPPDIKGILDEEAARYHRAVLGSL